jgi:hypothetical protein
MMINFSCIHFRTISFHTNRPLLGTEAGILGDVWYHLDDGTHPDNAKVKKVDLAAVMDAFVEAYDITFTLTSFFESEADEKWTS